MYLHIKIYIHIYMYTSQGVWAVESRQGCHMYVHIYIYLYIYIYTSQGVWAVESRQGCPWGHRTESQSEGKELHDCFCWYLNFCIYIYR
jgi:hypothetical protein